MKIVRADGRAFVPEESMTPYGVKMFTRFSRLLKPGIYKKFNTLRYDKFWANAHALPSEFTAVREPSDPPPNYV